MRRRFKELVLLMTLALVAIPSFAEDKKRTFRGMDISIKDGGRQVEYEDQDPRIHGLYVAELARFGIAPRMDQFLVPVR